MAKKTGRKKCNFMIDEKIIVRFYQLIPSGKRSDFVNEVIDNGLVHYSRGKAIEAMEHFRKRNRWHLTDEEIRQARAYGRE